MSNKLEMGVKWGLAFTSAVETQLNFATRVLFKIF